MMARRLTTLRLARRQITRSPGRSSLIALLIAIPVLAGTFAVVTIRTEQLSPEQDAQRVIGAADAVAVVTDRTRVGRTSLTGRDVNNVGYANTQQSPAAGSQRRQPVVVDMSALLPPGSRALPAGWKRLSRATAGDRTVPATEVLADLADPLTSGLYDVTSGAAPHAAGEAAVTAHLADRLGVQVGGDLSMGSGQDVRVTAIVRNPNRLDSDEVVGPVATFPLGSFRPGPRTLQPYTWLLRLPDGTPDLHDAMADAGVVYATRAQWVDPPRELGTRRPANRQIIAILAAIAGFGLLEIVLLCGAAMAVGARRQVRELGLLQSAGAEPADVRRVVLAQGAMLGGAGAVVGAGVGVLASFAARGAIESYYGRALGPFDVRALDLLAVLLIGIVAGLLAALVPARSAARMHVVDMLRGRFDGAAVVRRTPRWAWAALVVGPLTVIGAAAGWHHSRVAFMHPDSPAAFVRTLTGSSHDTAWTAALVVGAGVTLAGLIRVCPRLLQLLSLRAARLGLSGRLALRDASRHHDRTAPAVAAVMTVLAGAVLALFLLSSIDLRNKEAYQPSNPVGSVLVLTQGNSAQSASIGELGAVTARVSASLGNPPSYELGRAVPAGSAPTDQISPLVAKCNIRTTDCPQGAVSIATAGLVDRYAGRHVSGAAAALASGKAVVFDPTFAAGRVRVARVGRASRLHDIVTLPTLVVRGAPRYVFGPTVAVSAATAAEHDWHVVGDAGLVFPGRGVSQSQIDRIQHDLGRKSSVSIETGYHASYVPAVVALVVGAALAALGGTSIAVALALAESRDDMRTLAAVGAPPSRRRTYAVAQAAAVGGLGAALGLALGLLVSVALFAGSTTYPTSVPYGWLAIATLAAPLLSMLVAGAVTRGRIPLTRRIA